MASCGKYADISVSPGALSFEAVEGWKFVTPSQYVRITKANAGRDPHWTASVEGAWIRVSPTHNWGFGRIRINCETKDLSPGLYVGAIIIESDVAVDIPRIAVVLTVHPKDTVPLPPMEEEPPPGPPDDYQFPEPEEELPPETDGNGETHDDGEGPSEGAGKGLWERIIDMLWSLLRALFDRR